MTHSRYLRFIWVACADVFFTVPLGVFVVWLNATKGSPITPWPGWAAVHWGFNRVDTLTLEELISKWDLLALYWNQWINVFCSILYLINFGSTDDMRTFYVQCFFYIAKIFGYERRKNDETLPVMVFAGHNRGSSYAQVQ